MHRLLDLGDSRSGDVVEVLVLGGLIKHDLCVVVPSSPIESIVSFQAVDVPDHDLEHDSTERPKVGAG